MSDTTDPIAFPSPRPLTPEELADPLVQALLRTRDPAAAADAWSVLEELAEEPPTLPGNVTRFASARPRPRDGA